MQLRKKSSTGEVGSAHPGQDRSSDKDYVAEDDESLIDDEPSLDDLDEFSDDGDAAPGDRRRDPLRRTI